MEQHGKKESFPCGAEGKLLAVLSGNFGMLERGFESSQRVSVHMCLSFHIDIAAKVDLKPITWAFAKIYLFTK